jgi:hypothetical protein
LREGYHQMRKRALAAEHMLISRDQELQVLRRHKELQRVRELEDAALLPFARNSGTG